MVGRTSAIGRTWRCEGAGFRRRKLVVERAEFRDGPIFIRKAVIVWFAERDECRRLGAG